MIISINQPAYLPWLGYFERIARSDLHVVLDHVQFEKNSYINRNKIRTKDGVAWLTVPLATKGKFGKLAIHGLEIALPNKWKNKHWACLKMNYARSPCFNQYKAPYEELYSQEWGSFMPFVRALLNQSLLDLGIKTPLIYSSEMKVKGCKSGLILNICRSLGATAYLSGSQGWRYLEHKAFLEAGISLEYQDYRHPVYRQAWPGFESHLGIPDLLFNHGKNSLNIIMSDQAQRCGFND